MRGSESWQGAMGMSKRDSKGPFLTQARPGRGATLAAAASGAAGAGGGGRADGPPDVFKCPITLSIMTEPAQTPDRCAAVPAWRLMALSALQSLPTPSRHLLPPGASDFDTAAL